MTWIKLDVRFPRNRKVKRLSDAAFRLHVTAKCACGEHLTDGFVEVDDVADLTKSRRPNVLVAELVDAKLWEVVEGGYLVHDYLEHQESKAQVDARRASDRDRKRSGKKADSKQIPDGIQTESKQIPDVDEMRSDEIEIIPLIPSDDGRPLRQGLRANGTNPRAVAARREHTAGLIRFAAQWSYLSDDDFAERAKHVFQDTPDDLKAVLTQRSQMQHNPIDTTLIDLGDVTAMDCTTGGPGDDL